MYAVKFKSRTNQDNDPSHGKMNANICGKAQWKMWSIIAIHGDSLLKHKTW